MAKFKKWPKPKLEIKMLSSFRLDFPSFGYVIYRNYGSSTKDLVLIVREETKSSDGLMCPDTAFNTRLKRFIPVENGRDKYKFALPLVDFEYLASIVVPQVKPSDGSNGNESSKINGNDSGQNWISVPPPRRELEACKILKLWDENRGLAIQTRVVEKQKITCPGEVKLQVFSNERLPDNTTLTLHFLKRDSDYDFEAIIDAFNSAEFKLHLTSHVLTALISAGTTLKEARAA
ncbi:unnamed protein product [Hymenolepis diminuta]|uniref:UBX domain-containing protein n=1 Tax=Hymenolepis diminuta TaxID=6216 RepID=A0A0R3SY54_HYMDI|nr:unnamed protein product [Hymenolepis diminuta]